MRGSDSNRLDSTALFVLGTIAFANLVVFPLHRNFLIPADLYGHYPAILHPYREYFSKSRDLHKLVIGIESSAPTRSLPTSGQLFCFVETSEKYYKDRVPAVAATWLPRCDNGRFFSKSPLPDRRMPYSTVFKNLEDSYYDLFRKTFFAFYYSYTFISNDFDWYLKTDDDSYIVMDHLKEYLDTLDPSEPLYLGYRLKPFLEQGYNAGGAGYILSRAAVKLFVNHLYLDEERCPYDWAEDRGIGRCLASMGVFPEDTRDEHGLHRFNMFHPNEIAAVHPGYHFYPLKDGTSISKKFVSLHRISPDRMLFLDSLLYPSSGNRSFNMEFLRLL